jgi:signal peptidase I
MQNEIQDAVNEDVKTTPVGCGCIFGGPREPASAVATRKQGIWWPDVLAVGMLLILVFGLYQPVRVEGTSMLPQLEDQDRLFINKFVYSRAGSLMGENIQRGDVIVFNYPRDTTKSYIKRVVALPGDTVRIDHGTLYVNGTLVPEPYVPLRYADDRSFAELTLPPQQYFVLGDHRSIASDSRDFGPVRRELIYGRAAFVYWPVEQAGVVR